MNNSKLNYRVLFTLLCAVSMNFEGVCAGNTPIDDMELVVNKSAVMPRSLGVGADDIDKAIRRKVISESTRKAIPNMTGFASLSLGSISFLGSISGECIKALGITGSCINLLGATSNLYNWYTDRNSIEPGWHRLAHSTLNGLVVLSNVASASLGFTSVYSSDPYEKNACGVASLVVGASGLFFKGIDLFLTTSPTDDHKCKLARQRSIV